MQVYGLDALGRDVVKGYGSVLLPTTSGTHTRFVQTFTPASSSLLQEFIAWITGNPPELYDSKFVAQGEGREVTRVKAGGLVKVVVNVATRGMERMGYATSRK
jgi:B9 domain-containing protein 1